MKQKNDNGWRISAVWRLMLGVLFCGLHQAAADDALTSDSYTRLIREAAQVLLKEGNGRFVAGEGKHPNYDVARRVNTVAEGQEPFATVIACSDSRVPVEVLFDRGIGDLFVIRVAGNVAGPSELASVEYGVGHLNTPLLVVLGHTGCGAVTAAVQGTELHGHMRALAERIQPAAAKAAGISNPELALATAIEANVWQTIADVLKESGEVRGNISAGKVQVHGAVYDLQSGKVKWLGQHPEEATLLVTGEEADQASSDDPATGPAGSSASSLPFAASRSRASALMTAPPPQLPAEPSISRGRLAPLSSPYMNPLPAAGPKNRSGGSPSPGTDPSSSFRPPNQ